MIQILKNLLQCKSQKYRFVMLKLPLFIALRWDLETKKIFSINQQVTKSLYVSHYCNRNVYEPFYTEMFYLTSSGNHTRFRAYRIIGQIIFHLKNCTSPNYFIIQKCHLQPKHQVITQKITVGRFDGMIHIFKYLFVIFKFDQI